MIGTIDRRFTGNTRLIDLTVDDVRWIVADAVREVQDARQAEETCRTASASALQEGRYVHGIDGIARIFGVSRSTANKIKQSGVIDEAISQCGRSIVTDSVRAIELTRGTALGAKAEEVTREHAELKEKQQAARAV